MPKILAIDDKQDNLTTISALLKTLIPDSIVLTAGSGKEGIAKARAELPDTILLDIIMPGMDGFEVCRNLKSDEKTKHIPIIMLTAIKTDSESRVKGLELGADAFLSKPIDEMELAAQVKVMLRIKKAEDALRKEKDKLEDIVAEKTVAMRESEEKYRTLFESNEFLTYITDSKGNILLANNKAAKFFGKSKETIIGKSFFELRPDRSEMYKKVIDTILSTGETLQFETLYPTSEENKWLLVTVSPLKIEKETRLQIITQDITSRKQVEEALLESEEKYREIVEGTDDLITQVSSERQFTYLNHVAEKIFGVPKEECIGMSTSDFIHPDDRDRTMSWFNESVAKHQASGTLENRLVNRKTGEIHEMFWTVNLHYDEKGNLLNVSGIARDLTVRKKLEKILLKTNKLESLGTLAGGIAHNFNNVLMGIQGHISLMMIDKKPSHPDIGHLKGIEGNIQKASELTKDLLDFARGGKYEVRSVNLNELIKHENRMFGRTKKELTIKGRYEKDLWTVEVDQGQIQQVLLNLYVNAWQAMPTGGDLYIQTENVSLDEDYAKLFEISPGRYVKISVTDTGNGMDKETREKIFEPFFTTQNMGIGTGLGLSAVYGIVTNHRGHINVYSEKSEGTTFNIYLPATGSDVIEDKKPSKAVVKGKGAILLVDDEEMIIDVGKQLLEMLGYRVMVAKSGREAIDLYEKNKADTAMVILDMIMPRMSGGDTYDRLKEINPDIKVLLSTGYSITGQAQMILDRGCNGFIQKPFNTKEISQRISEILDRE